MADYGLSLDLHLAVGSKRGFLDVTAKTARRRRSDRRRSWRSDGTRWRGR